MDLAVVRSRTSVVYEKEGRHSTAHVYTNALFSFTKFCGTTHVAFRQVTRERLRCYGQYLYSSGLKPNTVSTYMRMLRSIYNRGVESAELRMCIVCFMMFIREWIFARRKRCLSENLIASSMKIPNRNVCVVRRLSLP